jgi:hypothetical protein
LIAWGFFGRWHAERQTKPHEVCVMHRLFLIGVFRIVCYTACLFPIKLSKITVRMSVIVLVSARLMAVNMTAMGVPAAILVRIDSNDAAYALQYPTGAISLHSSKSQSRAHGPRSTRGG